MRIRTGALAQQFWSFAGVGAVGFVIDASLFTFLTHWYGWQIVWARALSALCSLTSTWLLNRAFTFSTQQSRDKGAEYLRYLLTQLLGLAINLGIFAACLAIFPYLRKYPIIPLIIGAAVALFANFITAKHIAFGVKVNRQT